ncbi:hypothetical protein JRQ81_011153 [Phrynocephalus forsythii]|uniref:G-protein coupled receptors family 1 profile domain-containing protein n=1 Tax=Phrynocephalus forsythii TaxID=171643 RepID=A0A9Q1AQV0_9SAUR|nr:hypothetical protein JRQ81_011153 [Phrynocephalus forsythii]
MERTGVAQNGPLANGTERRPDNPRFLPYYQHSPAMAAVFIIAYLAVFLSCLAGNSLVCLVVVKNQCMRTVTNLFIFNLAISDLLATVIIIVVWLVAITIMCPSAIMLTVGHLEGQYMVLGGGRNATYPLYACYEAWPDNSMRRLYTTILFVHIYLVPLMLILFMYGRVGLKLCHSTAPVSDNAPCQATGRKRIKAVKMLVLVALLFMISWLPLWTLMLLVDYASLTDDQLDLLTGYCFPFAHWLAFSNSSINPVVYGYYNENFRKGFQAAFKFQLCSQERCRRGTYSEQSRGPDSFGTCHKVFAQASSSKSTASQRMQNPPPLFPKGGQPKCSGLGLEDIDRIVTYHGVSQAWEQIDT